MGQRDCLTETTPIVGDGVHPAASKLEQAGVIGYAMKPVYDLRSFVGGLQHHFGWQLLAILFVSQHISKGFVRDFTGAASTYIMKDYAVPAGHMGVYGGVIGLPWALKPVLGMLSDLCPIGGYAKAPYIVFSALVGTIALAVLGSMRSELKIEQVVMLLFCVSLYVSTVDLLTEATYAKSLRTKPAQGPNLISFVWGGMCVAGVFATLCSGYILSHGSPWTLYTLGALPASFILLPTMFGWLQEKRLNEEEVQQHRAHIFSQKEALVLCFVMLSATLTLSWSGMFLDTMANGLVSLVTVIVVLTSFSVLLNPIIAKVNAFGLIQMSLALSLGGASFYFVMDDESSFPDGPHFSKEFYSMILPLIGSFFTITGIWLYNRMAGDFTYQRMYVCGNVLYCFCSMFDIVFYLRLNKQWGINDHCFVIGSSAFQTVLGTWLWMPSTVIMSQLCPRGMEATMFALLAGCHNLGATISSNFGAVLLEWLAINPSGAKDESVQFQNMWIASLVACVLPAVSILLVPWFIPDKRQTESILPKDDMPANEGSLLRQWLYGEEPPAMRPDGPRRPSENRASAP
jgi:folate/biopterin transporter